MAKRRANRQWIIEPEGDYGFRVRMDRVTLSTQGREHREARWFRPGESVDIRLEGFTDPNVLTQGVNLWIAPVRWPGVPALLRTAGVFPVNNAGAQRVEVDSRGRTVTFRRTFPRPPMEFEYSVFALDKSRTVYIPPPQRPQQDGNAGSLSATRG